MGTTTPGANVRAGPWPDAPEDRVLLARVARQDLQAFRILVDRHLASIVSLARRMLRDEAEADDAVQEALLRLWRQERPWISAPRASALAAPGDLEPLPRPHPVGAAHRGYRRGARGGRSTDPGYGARGAGSRPARGRSDERLPERQRRALTLFSPRGPELAEVGEVLGVSDEAVESLLARARRAPARQPRKGLEEFAAKRDLNWITRNYGHERQEHH